MSSASPTRLSKQTASVAELTRQSSQVGVLDTSDGSSSMKSASINLPKMLQDESDAVAVNDAVNMGSYYVMRKSHSKMQSIRRSRFIMMVFPHHGMPSMVMICPAVLFSAWNFCRGKSVKEIRDATREFNIYGNQTPGWKHKFSPSDTKAKVITDSRFFQLVYCNTCDQDVTNRGVIRMSFAPDGAGKERKDKAFEFRPEPYSKEAAEAECRRAVDIIRCGMVNSYLQRPPMIDRQMRESATKAWLEQIKPNANSATEHGKTNLHHQVQLEGPEQVAKVGDLLSWGADPNVCFGPTQMTALHMASSWANVPVVKMLLDAGADPMAADVNGMSALHLACVFGCIEAVQLLLAWRGAANKTVDVNVEASTALGTLRPLDCAIECEATNAIDIWKLLCEHGAEKKYIRTLQTHPEPYPTQKLGPFIASVMSLARLSAVENDLNVSKIEFMIAEGADINERDNFGRSALCQVTSKEKTELLVRAGVDPNYGVAPAGLADYAKGAAGHAYMDVFMEALIALKAIAYPSSGVVDEATAPKAMAQIVLKAKHDVTCAARRALVSGYPFAEALVEGKLAKAQVLLENGVSPLVSIDNMPDLTLNLVDYVGNGGVFEQNHREEFGDAIWEGLGMRLLWFAHLYVPKMAFRGTQMALSEHAAAMGSSGDYSRKSFYNANKGHVLQLLLEAEDVLGPPDDTPIDQFSPTVEDMAQAENVVRGIIASLDVPMSPGLSPQKSSDDAEEDHAVNAVIQSAQRERTRSHGGGLLGSGESMASYRDRTMSSFKGRKNEDATPEPAVVQEEDSLEAML